MDSPIESFTDDGDSAQSSRNLRKHPHVEDNNNNQVVNLTSPAVSAARQQALVASRPDSTLPWATDVVNLGAELTPSPDVIDAMHSVYKQYLKGFAKTFWSFHVAIEHRDCFQHELGDGETIPDEVLRTLKGPTITFPECVHEACFNNITGLKKGHESQLAHTRKATAQYVLKSLNAAVIRLHEKCEVQGLVDSFGEELKSLSTELLTLASIEVNTERWYPYIARISHCLGRVLDDQKIKVIVTIRNERDAKSKKKAAVQTAQMDVEMKDATKTVEELVSERVEIEMRKYRQAEAQKAKTTKSNGSPPAKKQKPDPKPSTSNAEALSSKSAKMKVTSKTDKKAEKNKLVKGKERGTVDVKGKGTTKKKGKAKATSGNGSDSD
ncbi:hypothetical protein ARMGADRAFT_1027991 [Armillaria gallica]|uniref:Uncharacterized protein n=1 Tax=Armillaria gallica TaxID=47427 RepID=A0A2H3E1Z4_ARMGA|nr:hypothetical protein ARMGADRAFT_1027991 [Armillaria gallica]